MPKAKDDQDGMRKGFAEKMEKSMGKGMAGDFKKAMSKKSKKGMCK